MIWSLLMLAGVVLVVAVVGAWARRRQNVIDAYHPREFQDPPISDCGDRLGGGRF